MVATFSNPRLIRRVNASTMIHFASPLTLNISNMDIVRALKFYGLKYESFTLSKHYRTRVTTVNLINHTKLFLR